MKIERASVLEILLKPPLQQLGCRLRHLLENWRVAGFQASAFGLDQGSKLLGKGEIVDARHHGTSTTASASNPNTSTTRTQILRGPSFGGRPSRFAVVTTRCGSLSFSVFPR